MSNIIIDLDGNYATTKDPNAKLDYTFDWTKYLQGISDTIATASVTVEGATLESFLHSGNTVVAWVSGGEVGNTARVSCTINTTNGRIDERSILLNIKQL